MIEKEIGEIRRRLRPEKNNISHICGCYVNEKREVISLFDQPVLNMSQEETEAYLALFKRTLSGSLNRNLLDVEFETRQVAQGEEHRLLMALRDSELRDDEAVRTFYQRVIDSYQTEGNYLILLAKDTYDVPYRGKDDEDQSDAGSEVYSYILCSICTVKVTRPALRYDFEESIFHNREMGWVVSAPETGFLFPAFDDRSTNLYNALYYTKDITNSHVELVDALFHRPMPMPAAEQQETFQGILQDALSEECRLDVLQSVHQQIAEQVELHKENRTPEPLLLTKTAVHGMLKASGVSDRHVEAFEREYDERFGEDSALSPKNLMDSKQMEIRTPDVVIKVNGQRTDLVETRVIGGRKYILISAEDGVEVNGIPITFSGENERSDV